MFSFGLQGIQPNLQTCSFVFNKYLQKLLFCLQRLVRPVRLASNSGGSPQRRRNIIKDFVLRLDL